MHIYNTYTYWHCIATLSTIRNMKLCTAGHLNILPGEIFWFVNDYTTPVLFSDVKNYEKPLFLYLSKSSSLRVLERTALNTALLSKHPCYCKSNVNVFMMIATLGNMLHITWIFSKLAIGFNSVFKFCNYIRINYRKNKYTWFMTPSWNFISLKLHGRSQWPSGIRRMSAAAWLLGSRVRIPLETYV
jgi:hypothetical protein